MANISKISSYVMYGLLTISAFLTVLVMFGGTTAGDALEAPTYLDTILNWGKALIIGSIIIAFGFEIFNIITRPTAAKKSLISGGAIFIILFVSYILSDGTPLQIIGYEGTENIPSMLKVVDTGLFAFYLLMGTAVLSIIVSELSRIIRS